MNNEQHIEDISRITFDYAKRRKPVDANYIEKISDSIIKQENLQDMVKSVKTKYILKDLGQYAFEKMQVSVCPGKISKEWEYKEFLFQNWNELEFLYSRYAEINRTIVHEFKHAIQMKDCLSDKMGLETEILRLCFKAEILLAKARRNNNPIWRKEIYKIYIKLEELKYRQVCDYAPEERLANIDTYLDMEKIAENLKAKNLYNYERWCLLETYLSPYDSSINPTIFYLEKMGYTKEADEIQKRTRKLSYEKRLRLGLRLTQEEKLELGKELVRIQF